MKSIRVIPKGDEEERTQQYLAASVSESPKALFSALVNEFGSGSSIVLNSWQEYNSDIYTLTSMLQRMLFCSVGCNIYCTPPESQGFNTHVDAHDVLILQVDGEKRWKIHETQEELPLESHSVHHLGPQLVTSFQEKTDSFGKAIQEIVLRAGDVLYLPRGVPHSAASTDKHSIHFTLGLYPLRLHQLLTQLIDMTANKRVELRRRTPFDVGSLGKPGDLFRQVATWADENLDDDAPIKITEKHTAESQTSPTPSGVIHSMLCADNVHENTIVSRSDKEFFSVSKIDNEFEIFCGNTMRLPEKLSPIIPFLESHVTFKVGDMPEILAKSAKLVLAKNLVKKGIMRIEAIGEPPRSNPKEEFLAAMQGN